MRNTITRQRLLLALTVAARNVPCHAPCHVPCRVPCRVPCHVPRAEHSRGLGSANQHANVRKITFQCRRPHAPSIYPGCCVDPAARRTKANASTGVEWKPITLTYRPSRPIFFLCFSGPHPPYAVRSLGRGVQGSHGPFGALDRRYTTVTIDDSSIVYLLARFAFFLSCGSLLLLLCLVSQAPTTDSWQVKLTRND